jgi:hypothetical protein
MKNAITLRAFAKADATTHHSLIIVSMVQHLIVTEPIVDELSFMMCVARGNL